MRCRYCQGLSISLLVEFAKEEFIARAFPPSHYYSHHSSFQDLQESARTGCDICAAIDEGIRNEKFDFGYLEGFCREDLIKEAIEQGRETDIKIAINAEHLFSSSKNDRAQSVKLFDLVMVQIGMVDDILETEETEEAMSIPPLEFVIYAETRELPLNLGSFPISLNIYQKTVTKFMIIPSEDLSLTRIWRPKITSTLHFPGFKVVNNMYNVL